MAPHLLDHQNTPPSPIEFETAISVLLVFFFIYIVALIWLAILRRREILEQSTVSERVPLNVSWVGIGGDPSGGSAGSHQERGGH